MTHEVRQFNFANNARSTLAAALSSSGTQLTVQPGHGGRFPRAEATYDEIFSCILFQSDLETYEIVYATGRGGDVLTIERAKEGTVALSFPPGAVIVHNATAAFFAQLVAPRPSTPVLSGNINGADVDLSWTASTAGEITDPVVAYDVYRSEDGGSFGLLSSVSVLIYTDDTVALTDHEYTYYVVARALSGLESDQSNTQSFTIEWTPALLPSLGAWWDFSDTATITSTTPPLDDGDVIASITDKSGNGNTLAAGGLTPRWQAAQVNGLGVMQCDSTNDGVSRAAGTGITGMDGPNFSAFVVTVLNFSLNSFAGLMGRTNSGWITGWRFADTTGGGPSITVSVNTYTTAPITVSNGDTGVDHPHLYAMTWDEAGNQLTGFRNGVQTGQNTSYTGVVAHTQDIYVGVIPGGTSIDPTGMVCEVIYVNAVVSQADREKVEGYLAHKWGFADTLDVSHPYKSAPP